VEDARETILARELTDQQGAQHTQKNTAEAFHDQTADRVQITSRCSHDRAESLTFHWPSRAAMRGLAIPIGNLAVVCGGQN